MQRTRPYTKHVAPPRFSSRLLCLHLTTFLSPHAAANQTPNANHARVLKPNSHHHQHPPSSSSASPSNAGNARPSSGCGLLQAIQEQLSSGLYPTTGGAYLELIFIHREILYACPQLHRDCAMGFCDLAQFLEHRDWRADREGDAEAVAAFRHEAGLVAHVASAW